VLVVCHVVVLVFGQSSAAAAVACLELSRNIVVKKATTVHVGDDAVGRVEQIRCVLSVRCHATSRYVSQLLLSEVCLDKVALRETSWAKHKVSVVVCCGHMRRVVPIDEREQGNSTHLYRLESDLIP
jgi:hypothetical protein